MPTFALTLTVGFAPGPARAAEWPHVSQELRLAHYPQDLVKNLELKIPAKLAKSKIDAIVYGHKKIGFFEIRNFAVDGQLLKFKMLPPSYKLPITFYVLSKESPKPVKLTSEKFNNSVLFSLRSRRRAKGSVSFPYFFLNTDITEKNTLVTNELPGIFNRIGELIWISNETLEKTTSLNDGFLSLSNGDGNFLFLSRRAESELLQTDGLGTKVKLINFESSKIPWGNSHTFDYDESSKTLYYLSFDCRTLGFFDEFIPFLTGFQGFFRRLVAPRRSYMGSKLISLNLENLKTSELWNSYENFSPKNNQSLALQGMTSPDLFMDVKSIEQYKADLENTPRSNWYAWPDKRCNSDWTHENSVKYYPGKGFLISIRNLNKVIFLNEQGHLQYSVGNDPSDTYRFASEKEAFTMQHSAELIDDHHLLLFDNNADFRGSIHRLKQNRIMIVDLEKPGVVPRPELHYLPFPKAFIKGSTTLLRNKNIFAYKAGDPGTYSQILEIDRVNKSIVGKIKIKAINYSSSIESKPFYSLYGEKWRPDLESDNNQLAIPTEHEKLDDVLQYSY